MRTKLALAVILFLLILCSSSISEENMFEEECTTDSYEGNISLLEALPSIPAFNLIEEYPVELSHQAVQIERCGFLNVSLPYILYFSQYDEESLTYIMDMFSNDGSLVLSVQFCTFEPMESVWPYIQIEEEADTFIVEFYPNITVMDELYAYEYDYDGNLISQQVEHLPEGDASYISFQGENYLCRKQAHPQNDDDPRQLVSIQHLSTGSMYEVLIEDRMATMTEDDDGNFWLAFVGSNGDIMLSRFSLSADRLNRSLSAIPDNRLPESAYIQSAACNDGIIVLLVRISNGVYSLLCIDEATMHATASWYLQPPNNLSYFDRLVAAGDSIIVVAAQWNDSIQNTVLRPSHMTPLQLREAQRSLSAHRSPPPMPGQAWPALMN